MSLCRVEEAVDDFKAGKFVIIVDDEDRENEGDLAIASQHATPGAINFMTRHARGLICVPLDHRMVDRLQIPMMVPPNRNNSGFGTGFTISVEARHGVTTGISAFDRARTIQVLTDPGSPPHDLVMPGHIFPLRAQRGVLVYLKQEGRGIGLTNKIRAYALQDLGQDTVDANLELGFSADERSYEPAVAILRDLGITSLRLMTNNPEKVAALTRCGLQC